MSSNTRFHSLVRPLGAGACAGFCLGLVDAALSVYADAQVFDSRATLAGTATIFLADLSLGCLGGLVGGALKWSVDKVVGERVGLLRFIPFVLVACCLGGLFVDKWMYVFLYPYFHQLLAVGYLVASCWAAQYWVSEKVAKVAIGLVFVPMLSASFLTPALVGDSQPARKMISARSTLGQVMWSTWQPPIEEVESSSCEWPAPQRVARFGDGRNTRTHPNILLLTVDAARGDLAKPAVANLWPKTAAQLERGVEFRRAYAAGTRTTESLYSMFTGQWPHRLRFAPSVVETLPDGSDRFRVLDSDDPMLFDPQSWRQHHPLPIIDKHQTLAELLGENGYRTHTAVTSLFFLPGAGITRGFKDTRDSAYKKVETKEIRSEDFSSTELTDQVLDAILNGAIVASAQGPKLGAVEKSPWFVWAHYLDAHAPYRVDSEKQASLSPFERYRAELDRVDSDIARLLVELRKNGELDNTLVIITADHGEEFRDHGGQYHGTTVYEELLHVPLIVQLPTSIRAARNKVTRRVSLVDIVPTVSQLLGLSPEQAYDGRSFLGEIVERETPRGLRPVLGMASLHGRRAAVLLGQYKLIEDPERGTIELYDLASDPREQRNLVGDSPEVVGHLRCLLERSGVWGEG